MTDSFYTPPELAKKLVDFVKLRNVKKVADFCVGNGELLRAAQNRWKGIQCYATDISEYALNDVKIKHPDWRSGKCDFLDKNTRSRCSALRDCGKVDLILLNPPFSCVGSTRYLVCLDGNSYFCSTAMRFLIEALNFLKKSGGLYAILPSSVAYSEKDKRLWDKLVLDYKLKVLRESQKKYFEDCSPNIILVSVNVDGHICTSTKITKIDHDIKNISIFRGQVSINAVDKKNKNGTILVHSTNLQNNVLVNLNMRLAIKFTEISGPAVLIPRVGKPRIDKVCLLHVKQKVFLSDCVIALKTKTFSDAEQLQKKIIHNWKMFNTLYRGTGARYITISRIKEFLGI